MLPLQFIGQNIHFAISLFAALVFFAVAWLYFDAWGANKQKKELLKSAGFLLVSLSFLAHSTLIEQSVLGTSALGDKTATISTILRLLGYIGIIWGCIIDPLQIEPDVEALFKQPGATPAAKAPAAVATSSSFGLVFALPLGAAAVTWLYWRRATKGLEKHLKPAAIAFASLTLFEIVSLAGLFRDSANPKIASLVAAFGPVWIIEQGLLLISALLLGRWVWEYLIKRFISQLFMVFVSLTLTIFLLTTVGFTFLLMHNVQNDTLDNLSTAANVLSYGFDAKKTETRANAQALASNPQLSQAVTAKDHKALQALTSGFLGTNKQSSLVITTETGQVLLRGEDPDRWGDSLSSDTQVQRALIGKDSSSLVSKEGVLAPLMYIKTAVPVRDASQKIIGTVSVGLVIDNGFTDGIKKSTGLDSAIYSGNIRSATSFIAPDGKSRWIGVKENSQTVKQTVLVSGKTYKGELNILNRPFLAVYSPLKDADNTIIGMLFIGEPQANILQTAGHSIELTFLLAVALLILTILPAYYMAKHLSDQLS
jgi:arginine exporter protein ArgO